MSQLFEPFKQRDVTLRNRIVVSPMCQYSSEDGFASDWHLVHLGSRAVGGAGLVFTEATAVAPEGRISPQDLGIWKDEHIPALKRVTDFIKAQGGVPGIQLAHAGRKAATAQPWQGGAPLSMAQGGWMPVGPSAVPFAPGYPAPEPLTPEGIAKITASFAAAARRAAEAGFEVVELHAAHGYLLNAFLSPLSNQRTDRYGGSLENRMRLVIETARALRKSWPERLPLWTRISVTDWMEGGWDAASSVELAKKLKAEGVDLIDCSSGGTSPEAKIPIGPGYQVALSAQVRREADVATGAVGMITDGAQADTIVRAGQADVVLLAREFLRDPYFPLRTAGPLRAKVKGPVQYGRAFS